MAPTSSWQSCAQSAALVTFSSCCLSVAPLVCDSLFPEIRVYPVNSDSHPWSVIVADVAVDWVLVFEDVVVADVLVADDDVIVSVRLVTVVAVCVTVTDVDVVV